MTLQPGEKRRVEFTLGPQQLGFYNREMRFVVEPGEFAIMVGTSSRDEDLTTVTLRVRD